MKNTGSFLTCASLLLLGLVGTVAACGRSELGDETLLLEPGQEGGSDVVNPGEGGSDTGMGESGRPEGGDDFRPPPHCGDHACDDGETCSNCPQDCGLCASCGDGKCDSGETCNSCPQDCGACPGCPDGECEASETCLSCPEDCGACSTCGNGKCESMFGENCTTCPEDCGACSTCGNGTCDPGENCFSCSEDCGVCSSCGNGKCETDETCANCPADCGACPKVTCIGLVTCSIGCIMSFPPDLGCLAMCLDGACPNALNAANEVIDCATTAFMDGTCMGFDLGCIESACPSQIASCLTISCTEM